MHDPQFSTPDGDDAMVTLRAVLDEIDWLSVSDASGNNVFINLNTSDVPVAYVHAAISERLAQFVLYVVLALVPASERRTDCALVITHINSKLLVGGFDLDLDTGRLSFRNGVSFQGSRLQPQQIRNIILHAMSAVQIYTPAIVDVVNGQSAREAIEAIQAADAG